MSLALLSCVFKLKFVPRYILHLLCIPNYSLHNLCINRFTNPLCREATIELSDIYSIRTQGALHIEHKDSQSHYTVNLKCLLKLTDDALY